MDSSFREAQPYPAASARKITNFSEKTRPRAQGDLPDRRPLPGSPGRHIRLDCPEIRRFAEKPSGPERSSRSQALANRHEDSPAHPEKKKVGHGCASRKLEPEGGELLILRGVGANRESISLVMRITNSAKINGAEFSGGTCQ